jgi:hypothetical protein
VWALAWLGISESQSQRPRPRLSTQGAPVSVSQHYHCLVGFTILTFPLDLLSRTCRMSATPLSTSSQMPLSTSLAHPLTFPPSPPFLSCTELYDFPLQPLAKLQWHQTRAHVAGCKSCGGFLGCSGCGRQGTRGWCTGNIWNRRQRLRRWRARSYL